ncbi:MAG: nickel pincer cofactor biosynthesis protein LarC [Magnetococcus sp. DMHC-8]
MFLAACLDLGLDREGLSRALATVATGCSLAVTRGKRGGLDGVQVAVTVPHEHHHRHLQDILPLIHHADLPDPAKALASTVFANLAQAEARVHGIDVAEVHFHEVGAMDAIVDVCGAAYAVWQLGITHITASPVPTGTGWVDCQHGRLPVPAPAVAELLRAHRVPIRPDAVEAELVTPTGAALLVTLVQRFGAAELTRIDRIGHGLGSRMLPDRANLLRILAQDADSPVLDPPVLRESVVVLSSHLDDMNPEWYGPLWEQLWQAGALDVALIPLTMKKGRPGVRIEIVAPPGRETDLARLVLIHTTSLGVRMAPMDRLILSRTQRRVVTPWGPLRAKEAGGVWRLEHDDLARLAAAQGWSLPRAHQQVAPFLAAALDAPAQLPAQTARP